jgi:hypothetical protein
MNVRLAISIAFAASLLGCRADQKQSHVMVHSTTQSIDHEPGQQVNLTVRDATASGMAQSLIGRDCRVQFRRDALGMAGASPVGPTQQWNGQTTLKGKIVELNDQWLILSVDSKRYCIPHASILLIEVPD